MILMTLASCHGRGRINLSAIEQLSCDLSTINNGLWPLRLDGSGLLRALALRILQGKMLA
jgi:hypothetical protein